MYFQKNVLTPTPLQQASHGPSPTALQYNSTPSEAIACPLTIRGSSVDLSLGAVICFFVAAMGPLLSREGLNADYRKKGLNPMAEWTEANDDERNEMAAADKLAREQAERLAAERRIAMRMVLHAQVNVKSESNFFMGFAENISEGGVFVSTFSPPAVGDEVELAVGVEGSDAIPVKGIVRWHRTDEQGNSSGCGVQFVDLTDDARRTLEMLLVTLEKEPLFHDVD